MGSICFKAKNKGENKEEHLMDARNQAGVKHR